MSPMPAELMSSGGICLIRVPAGSFLLGSPTDEDGCAQWEVECREMSNAEFYLGVTPVTQRQYAAVTGVNPTDHAVCDDAPVDSVRGTAAPEYCERLTEIDRAAGILPGDWEYRLPTEIEWECACRAGTQSPVYGPLDAIAWHYGNADQRPHPVGQKAPNPWGFYDMLGNVWEQCQGRVTRGGSYFNTARCCRAAARSPLWGGRYCGFRLAAAPVGPLEPYPAVSASRPSMKRPPSIYDAIDANDFELALRIARADPLAVESPDEFPPPLETCGDGDLPEWVEWLLDHGADIERRNQDYGTTPLICAIIRRQKRIIRTLIRRGADTSRALQAARRGLAGAYEADPSLTREGYAEILDLLQELGIRDP